MENIDDIFQPSFERALGSGGFNNAFVERFYVNFIGQSLEIADLFQNTNMSRQKTMLHDSLYLMVEYYKTRQATKGLQRIAQVHSRSGKDISEELYESWVDSLIATLKEFDPQFNKQVEQAWRQVLAPGVSYMQSKH